MSSDPSVNSDTSPIVLLLIALYLITKSMRVATRSILKVAHALHLMRPDIALTCLDEMAYSFLVPVISDYPLEELTFSASLIRLGFKSLSASSHW